VRYVIPLLPDVLLPRFPALPHRYYGRSLPCRLFVPVILWTLPLPYCLPHYLVAVCTLHYHHYAVTLPVPRGLRVWFYHTPPTVHAMPRCRLRFDTLRSPTFAVAFAIPDVPLEHVAAPDFYHVVATPTALRIWTRTFTVFCPVDVTTVVTHVVPGLHIAYTLTLLPVHLRPT